MDTEKFERERAAIIEKQKAALAKQCDLAQ